MQSRKRKRVRLILFGLILLASSATLVGYAMKDSIEFFKSPTEIISDPPVVGKRFRVGGLVEPNSVVVLKDGSVSFEVTDQVTAIEVRFTGILPDLFAENQGVIAVGSLNTDRVFYADEVLAKHDENYIPKEIMDNLKDKGVYVDPNGK